MAPYNLQLQAGGLLVLHILVHLLLTNIGYMVKCVSQVRKSGIHYTVHHLGKPTMKYYPWS